MTWVSQNRWPLALSLVALVALGVFVAWYWLFRSPGTPFSLTEALQHFRKGESPAHGETVPTLPPAGVYTYRTSGSEELSLGLHRSFPTRTYMSVVDDNGCSTMDWLPIEQHTEALTNCVQPTGSLVTRSTSSTETIAGIHTLTVMRCQPTAFFVPAHPRVGETWQSSCTTAGEHVAIRGRIYGSSVVRVGTSILSALHVQIVSTFSGAESGTCPTDYWIEPDGLVLRQVESAEVAQQSGPLGSVRYGEQMAISLMSTSPRR